MGLLEKRGPILMPRIDRRRVDANYPFQTGHLFAVTRSSEDPLHPPHYLVYSAVEFCTGFSAPNGVGMIAAEQLRLTLVSSLL